MDKRTKVAALAALAKAAAELAADIATATSEAAGAARNPEASQLPQVTANLIVGTILPAEQRLESLQAIFRAMSAINQTSAI